jgi:hypothetical protein
MSTDAPGHTVSTAPIGTARARTPVSRRKVPSIRLSTRFTRPNGRPSLRTAENPWQRSSQYSRTALPRPKPVRVSVWVLGASILNLEVATELPGFAFGRNVPAKLPRPHAGGSSAENARAVSRRARPGGCSVDVAIDGRVDQRFGGCLSGQTVARNLCAPAAEGAERGGTGRGVCQLGPSPQGLSIAEPARANRVDVR